MIAVPALAVDDGRCGVDELALLFVVARHGDVGATSAQLTDRLCCGAKRLRASRQILEELGYIDVETLPRGDLILRVRAACGSNAAESTPACDLSADPGRTDQGAAEPWSNGPGSAGDVPDPSTPGVDTKLGATSVDAVGPQCPQGSTTSTQPPLPPHAGGASTGDVHTQGAPHEAAAPGDSRWHMVRDAIDALVDEDLDRVFASGTRVNSREALREHIRERVTHDEGPGLLALARANSGITSGVELLAARRRARALKSAVTCARRLAHLQDDVDVESWATFEFRRADDPTSIVAAAVDAYQAERPTGRREWRDTAHEFGVQLAGGKLTRDHVEQRAESRFAPDDELCEIVLAAWTAARQEKASA